MQHEISRHGQNVLSIRELCLDHSTGNKAWQSVHFGVTLAEVKLMYEISDRVTIDMKNKKLCYHQRVEKVDETNIAQETNVTNSGVQHIL